MNVERNGQQFDEDEVNLTALALGEVDDPQEIARLQSLLKKDPSRQSEFEAIQQISGLIRESVESDLPMAPGSLHDVVLAELESEPGGRAAGFRPQVAPRSIWRENKQVISLSISLCLMVVLSLAIWRPWEDRRGDVSNVAMAESNDSTEKDSDDGSRTESRLAEEEVDESSMIPSGKWGGSVGGELSGQANPFFKKSESAQGAESQGAESQGAESQGAESTFDAKRQNAQAGAAVDEFQNSANRFSSSKERRKSRVDLPSGREQSSPEPGDQPRFDQESAPNAGPRPKMRAREKVRNAKTISNLYKESVAGENLSGAGRSISPGSTPSSVKGSGSSGNYQRPTSGAKAAPKKGKMLPGFSAGGTLPANEAGRKKYGIDPKRGSGLGGNFGDGGLGGGGLGAGGLGGDYGGGAGGGGSSGKIAKGRNSGLESAGSGPGGGAPVPSKTLLKKKSEESGKSIDSKSPAGGFEGFGFNPTIKRDGKSNSVGGKSVGKAISKSPEPTPSSPKDKSTKPLSDSTALPKLDALKQLEGKTPTLELKKQTDKSVNDPNQPDSPREFSEQKLSEQQSKNKAAAGDDQDRSGQSDQLADESYREREIRKWIAAEYENDFVQPLGTNAISTFSVDTDTASYTNVRQLLRNNRRPDPNLVRIEELINYFDYSYPQPKPADPFSVNLELASSPWTPGNKLLRVGLKAGDLENANRPPSNLVFLVDVSGSMRNANKLPLLQQGLKDMVDQLREDDYVSIVTYSDQILAPLQPTDGSQKEKIKSVIGSLKAQGSTNGSGGLQEAYRLAKLHFLENGSNRIVMGTDGDFNVGIQDDAELVAFIKEKAQSGVFLTVCGFGTDNFKDQKVQRMAQNGNGKVYYIDSPEESRRVFVEKISGGLVTAAKDVKLQLLFNPRTVQSYRLIGYESRKLEARDFADDSKDAGEMDAGDDVTALYEIVPADDEFTFPTLSTPENTIDLKYQIVEKQKFKLTDSAKSDDIAALRIRFKKPNSNKSELREFVVKNNATHYSRASEDMKFVSAVAGLGLMLRKSKHRGTLNFDGLKELAQGALHSESRKRTSDRGTDLDEGRDEPKIADQPNLAGDDQGKSGERSKQDQRSELIELIERASRLYAPEAKPNE